MALALPANCRWDPSQSLQKPHNPAHLAKLVEVFRVYFNYCEIGKDKCTPAMRMGLARGPVAPEDILYFVPRQQPRRRARAVAAK